MKQIFMKANVFLLTAYATSSLAAETGIVGVGSRMQKAIDTLTITGVSAAALGGIALMVMGGLKLKAYSDDPRSTPLSKPLVYIVSGALLTGISATTTTMQETIFGDEKGEANTSTFKVKTS